MKVDEAGKLVSVSKSVGRKKALRTLVDNLVESIDESADRIFISHGDCFADVEQVKSMISQRFPTLPITVHFIGPVIGCHSGAGTLALFVKGKKR